MEAEFDRMSGKIGEMHAILLQKRGVRWAISALRKCCRRNRRSCWRIQRGKDAVQRI
jgi:hypothetical protein